MSTGQTEPTVRLLKTVSSYDDELHSGNEALRAAGLPSPLDAIRQSPYEQLILPTLFLLLEARRDRRDADFRLLSNLATRSIERLGNVGAADHEIRRCRIGMSYLELAVFKPADGQPGSRRDFALFWESTKPLREQPDPDPILRLATAYGRVLEARGVVEAVVDFGQPRSQEVAMNRLKFERAHRALQEAAETAPMDWLRNLARVHLDELLLAQRV